MHQRPTVTISDYEGNAWILLCRARKVLGRERMAAIEAASDVRLIARTPTALTPSRIYWNLLAAVGQLCEID